MMVQTVAMKPRHALAAIAALGIVATATVAAPAGATSSDELPPDYNYVVDDTQTLIVAVPDAWTDRDTEPAFDDDGTPVPYIEVSPDRESFRTTFDTPGITFWALAYTEDLQGLIDTYGLSGGCGSMNVEPYDDTVFVGLQQVGTNCNVDGLATWKMIAASPADHAFTVVVHLQTSGPEDEDAIGWARYTFNRIDDLGGPIDIPVGGDTPVSGDTPIIVDKPVGGGSPVGGDTPVGGGSISGVTTGPAANIVGYPGDVVGVTSERGDIFVEVPASWSSITYEVIESNGNGMLNAATNLDGFLGDGPQAFTSDGVRILYVANGGLETDSTVTFLSAAFAIGCTKGEPQPVSLSNGFNGHAVAITDCEAGDVLRNVVVAQGPSGSQIAVITQVLNADDPAMDLVLATATSPL